MFSRVVVACQEKRMLIRLLGALLAIVLILTIATASAVTQKSSLTWPVAAPTRVAAQASDYRAIGWAVSSPFGWRPNPDQPGSWELHEGADLAGPMFCMGCEVPPLGDLEIMRVGWDQEWANDPLRSGAGVVVDMTLQHPEEAGDVRIRYGHLHPYRVYVRTRSCTQTVDCPSYQPDAAGSVSVSCPGRVVETGSGHAEHAYAYATPGSCTATVSWPDNYMPQSQTTVHFDQQIVPGVASSDAAITFNAHLPPPSPPITPTVGLPSLTPVP
jgi:hypothetical protein